MQYFDVTNSLNLESNCLYLHLDAGPVSGTLSPASRFFRFPDLPLLQRAYLPFEEPVALRKTLYT
jgi:hypothetical protein